MKHATHTSESRPSKSNKLSRGEGGNGNGHRSSHAESSRTDQPSITEVLRTPKAEPEQLNKTMLLRGAVGAEEGGFHGALAAGSAGDGREDRRCVQ